MKEIFEVLEQIPIMKGANPGCILEAAKISKPYFCEYIKNEVMIAPGELTNKLCILCKGQASAYSAYHTHAVMLRNFAPYEIFGISNMFTDLPFASKVVAKSPCTVLILDQSFMSYLIDHDASVRYQYIAFLAQKTLFLNQKISCLTAGSAEQRLVYWLDAHAGNHDDIVEIEVPLKTLCTMLDMGRASLYRAFDQLEADGFIKRDGKTVQLINREKMLSFY